MLFYIFYTTFKSRQISLREIRAALSPRGERVATRAVPPFFSFFFCLQLSGWLCFIQNFARDNFLVAMGSFMCAK